MKAKDVRYPDAALARGVAARRERQERASESGPEAALREHERSCERCRPRGLAGEDARRAGVRTASASSGMYATYASEGPHDRLRP